jgi:phosphoglycolate phosphatase-like HAD superfamily hydrolase
MKPTRPSSGISRRGLLSTAAVLPTLPGLFLSTTARAQAPAGVLPSWNDGPAKQAILDFVHATIDQASPSYVPADDRVATFDQDGTLWVEHPIYTQAMFALDRVRVLAPAHPEWKNDEPFKTVLSGDLEAVGHFTEKDWTEIIGATHAGMSTDEFLDIAKQWLETAKHPRFKRLYTELVYQPMFEVLDYLRASDFDTYIVTGGGQEFVRVYSQRVYGIPPEQVVGWQTGADAAAKGVLHRRSRRQGDRHQPLHRQAPPRRLRQFRRRPRDAGMDRRRRWRAVEDARPSR